LKWGHTPYDIFLGCDPVHNAPQMDIAIFSSTNKHTDALTHTDSTNRQADSD